MRDNTREKFNEFGDAYVRFFEDVVFEWLVKFPGLEVPIRSYRMTDTDCRIMSSKGYAFDAVNWKFVKKTSPDQKDIFWDFA